jgi:alkanesulfonate monooxygenase SsuD/methylene tetrahydromethanopterin reductase-like flavin-dependent oxidoreductase (luciferase family)
MIKPWLFEFFHSVHDPAGHDDPETVHDHYRKYFDLWVADEARGFEGIFFSEHHFGPGYSPSPNLLISHLAARTNTMRLGVLGTVSAYSTPWRVAEEFAMLDHLTNGRLEMGVVSGIPPELALTGTTVPRAAELHAEVLDVLQAAVTKPVVSHSGAHFSFDDLRMTPTFLQSSPSIWTASTSEASARRAGERGLKMCGGFKNATTLVPQYEAYQEGARSAGMATGPDRVGIRRQLVIVDDAGDDAEKIAKDGVAELARASGEAMKIPDLHLPVEEEELIYGTAEQVADEIIRQCQVLQAGHFLGSFNIFDTDQLRHMHDLFGQEVIPRLRAAEVG